MSATNSRHARARRLEKPAATGRIQKNPHSACTSTHPHESKKIEGREICLFFSLPNSFLLVGKLELTSVTLSLDIYLRQVLYTRPVCASPFRTRKPSFCQVASSFHVLGKGFLFVMQRADCRMSFISEYFIEAPDFYSLFGIVYSFFYT